MYKAFFNLKRNPFEITPDPSFLFPTGRHNEALAALYYGVRRHKGFVVLTGEVGTGKTLLLRCLLQLLKQSADVKYAYVFNGRLTPLEFLQYIAGDLGLPSAGKNKSELLLQLAAYVVARGERKLTTVLVVDEAHHLSAEILEEIRLLTNLETAEEKLLQILLVGQPELDDKLDSVDLRQLKQRIAVRSHLSPLDTNETKGYIECRLQLAGSTEPGQIFPAETVAAIHRHSRGFPRLINTVCENGLIAAYARQSASVTPEMIDTIAADFRLGVQTVAVERKNSEEADLRKAAKALLDLYAHLQNEKAHEEDLAARMPIRVIKQ
ncbi:MAG TPA: AAA family ATPase [Candidatus Sulfotelmatobacter sp.]|jgi:general secretion pathway protein A|nr:AAA family ATPase [Acidobacteriaceae bacterium]